MRLIKLGLISAVGLFVVIFLLSLLIPSEMRVSRAITIEAPADSVMPYVKDMRQWKNWNFLLNNEQLTGVNYTETSFSSSEMSVKLISADSGLIKTVWRRVGQEPIEGGLGITGVDNKTVVQAYFDFKVKWYPWEKFGSIVFDKEIGPPLEKSLEDLKKLVLKTP